MKRPYLVSVGHDNVYDAPTLNVRREKLELVPRGHNEMHIDPAFSPAGASYVIDSYVSKGPKNRPL